MVGAGDYATSAGGVPGHSCGASGGSTLHSRRTEIARVSSQCLLEHAVTDALALSVDDRGVWAKRLGVASDPGLSSMALISTVIDLTASAVFDSWGRIP